MTTDIIEKAVPDTSVLISGVFSGLIEKGIVKGEIIIPEFVIEELRSQASRGKETGFRGLEELKKIRELCQEKNIELKKTGRRQTYEEIKLARYGRIDALILDVAREFSAIIYTSDMVQALVGEAEGIKVQYFKPYKQGKTTTIESLLTEDTMSLHIKVNTKPYAKRGAPGKMNIVYIDDNKYTEDNVEKMITEIFDAARYEQDSFVEFDQHGASVVQLKNMRIAITRPPFSDGIEITVVRPVVKMNLDDYRLSDKLKERLLERAEGVVISGPPGSGKSTFAASIAEFLLKEKQATIKTLESPRDLQVPEEITQYAPLEGSFVKSADILLLVRPDYTIFDEIRKPKDFEVFADLRMAGIGMLGVVHASDPIDSIQRFIGKVELGMIPHIIDTVIFIKAGQVQKIFDLAITVRVPSGMTEADLARPLVEIRDFETGVLDYEIYSYGEENVVIPIKEEKESAVIKLAKQKILDEIRRFDRSATCDIIGDKAIVTVDNDVVAKIIGREGKNIKELEQYLGIRIDVNPRIAVVGKETQFTWEESGAYIIFNMSEKLFGKLASFYADEKFLFSATVGKQGKIKLAKACDLGNESFTALLKYNMKAFVL
ncbi:MAG: PINc/VapC family ATPase [Candidatus Aenigmatarchaeota archaeon]